VFKITPLHGPHRKHRLVLLRMREKRKKREKKKKMGGGNERHYIGRGTRNLSPVLKVPRQCPLVLLV
jgi:hypothetical protein